MPKIVNRVDHVCWLSRYENLQRNLDRLTAMTGAVWDGPHVREHWGVCNYISWSAGLEIVAPVDGTDTPLTRELRAFLDARGEGMWAIVFGVSDIDASVAEARAKGFDAGAPFSLGDPHWTGKVHQGREAWIGECMGTRLLYGEIEYGEGILPALEKGRLGSVSQAE